MDALNDGNAMAGELKLANEVRLYKKVITLADLVSMDGTTIVAEALDASTAPSRFEFGNHSTPSDRAFQVWRRLLRRRFAPQLSKYTRPRNGYTLQTPLGAWSPLTERHIPVHFSYCTRSDTLYQTTQDTDGTLQYRTYRSQLYRTEKFYATNEVSPTYDHRCIPVDVQDCGRYIVIRGGIPLRPDQGSTAPSTFADHVQSLPMHTQRILGKISYCEEELEEMTTITLLPRIFGTS